MLLYHVLPGATLSNNFIPGSSQTLLNGYPVDVGVNPTTFDDASINIPDLPATNGLVNVIDTLLNPFNGMYE